MIDLAQADSSMRRTESETGLYIVVHNDKTLLGINLTWEQAAKIVSNNNFLARMIRCKR